MLLLNRKIGQSVVINNDIECTILEVVDNQIRFGIRSIKKVSNYRKKSYKHANNNKIKSA